MIARVELQAVVRHAGHDLTVHVPGEVAVCDGCSATLAVAGGEGCALDAARDEGWDCGEGEWCPECARGARRCG